MLLASTSICQSYRQIQILCSRKYSYLRQMPGRQAWLPHVPFQSSSQQRVKNRAILGKSVLLGVLKSKGQARTRDRTGHTWMTFLCSLYQDFFPAGETNHHFLHRRSNKATTHNSDKINLTFKISCSCLKTAWTSSCKSHLNSSSYVMGRKQWNH